mgnify:CR=1 FL=1
MDWLSDNVVMRQFVRPALLKMMGHKNLFRRTIKAQLAEPVEKGIDVRQFIRAHLADPLLYAAEGEKPMEKSKLLLKLRLKKLMKKKS